MKPKYSLAMRGAFAAERSVRPPTSSRSPEPGAIREDPDSESDSTDDPPAPPSAPPYVTYGILALITAIFAAMAVAGHGDITTVALQFGAKDNNLIRHGQYWRLVTPIFLHGNWLHLLVNGISLYRLGAAMEQIYGRKKYLALFLFAGVAGNLLSYSLSPKESLGASGALFGLVGAGLVFPIRFRDLIPLEARRSILTQLAGVAVLNLALGFWLRGIVDNWAHIGGLLGGAFLAMFLIPNVLESESRSVLSRAMVRGLVVVLVAMVLLSWLFQWQWVRQTPPTRMVSYYPCGGPQWWSISLPSQWRYSNSSWSAPDGSSMKVAELSIGDVAKRPELRNFVMTRVPFNSELDGRRGWYSATPGRLQYRVPIYDRIFELTLDGRGGRLSPSAKSDFNVAAHSVRFIRPPFDVRAGSGSR